MSCTLTPLPESLPRELVGRDLDTGSGLRLLTTSEVGPPITPNFLDPLASLSSDDSDGSTSDSYCTVVERARTVPEYESCNLNHTWHFGIPDAGQEGRYDLNQLPFGLHSTDNTRIIHETSITSRGAARFSFVPQREEGSAPDPLEGHLSMHLVPRDIRDGITSSVHHNGDEDGIPRSGVPLEKKFVYLPKFSETRQGLEGGCGWRRETITH